MIDTIREYLRGNNYNGAGLIDYLNRAGFRAQYGAATTNNTSGIIKVRGQKYYYHCIKPWTNCPKGSIEVKRIALH